jgi:tetratricopeptide (TPR) repeat protein
MPVRLRLFGAPAIIEGDEATPLPLTKPSSLLYHLACRDGWVSRSELAFLYRSDEAEDEALGYLRKLVFRARQFPWATGFDAQDSRLCWGAASDVRAFREAVAARRWAEALACYRQALASSRQAGYMRGVAAALVNVGVTLEALERLDEAETHYRESLKVYREVGDVRGEAAALTNLGHLAERRGAYPEAKAYYERSVAIKRPLGDPVVTAISLANLGDVQLALGDEGQALEALAEALALTRRAEARPYALRVVWSYAKFYAQLTNWREAICLASFLAHSSESEVWVRDEAARALEVWGDRIESARRSEAERRGRTATFERLAAEIASLDRPVSQRVAEQVERQWNAGPLDSWHACRTPPYELHRGRRGARRHASLSIAGCK